MQQPMPLASSAACVAVMQQHHLMDAALGPWEILITASAR
jgi:hypothetical protein